PDLRRAAVRGARGRWRPRRTWRLRAGRRGIHDAVMAMATCRRPGQLQAKLAPRCAGCSRSEPAPAGA
ncbi:MAG: hypothetical protein M0C28_17460, partial [Candidatus Moduliflexus flocculans]|nr:hypothetical protein [Candidatus Moduliflexus flocculans]